MALDRMSRAVLPKAGWLIAAELATLTFVGLSPGWLNIDMPFVRFSAGADAT